MKLPYAVQRYVGETERLYGVLDARLADRDYVAGPGRGRYSTADIAMLGWSSVARVAGVDWERFPNVAAGLARCLARPATHRGLAIPKASPGAPAAYDKRLAEDAEFRESREATLRFIKDAQAEYHYKYTSP